MDEIIKNKEVLVLGAGNKINPSAINHDIIKHRPEIDVVWNLNILPWPWKDNSFIFIEARSVLEHLSIGLIESFNECWRIIKPEGEMFVKLPNWESPICYDDPTHKRGYTVNSLNVFDPDTANGKKYSFYTQYKWKILTVDFGSNAKSSILYKLKVRKN